ncbi:hypothetical protein SERLA73DRAFT_147924 [Serpula lacrymans var. lacrymans S7.3]|uniref:Copia protein n=1 Tax=Serpula lacrymans var. lacrymans (strain S7.3) TaxID=936435 RepID=F8QIA4_SERL3|nr:hypothetical protein SERLA73DRAFT_147924 [Serpula lacrymans var. lacrymans S7.3]
MTDISGSAPEGLTPVYTDNQGTIALTKNNIFHARTKHIEICHHYIHDTVEKGQTIVLYCPTDEMPANLMTKVLPRVKLSKFTGMLGVR